MSGAKPSARGGELETRDQVDLHSQPLSTRVMDAFDRAKGAQVVTYYLRRDRDALIWLRSSVPEGVQGRRTWIEVKSFPWTPP